MEEIKLTKLPAKEPLIKLDPIMKLIGKLILSVRIRLIFDFFELFCIPIISTKNKLEFKTAEKDNFLIKNIIFS